MAIERTPPRLSEILTGLHTPSISSKPNLTVSQVQPRESLPVFANQANLAAHVRMLKSTVNGAKRKKVIDWLTSEALENGPYAGLPDEMKHQLKDKIVDMLNSAPNILV